MYCTHHSLGFDHSVENMDIFLQKLHIWQETIQVEGNGDVLYHTYSRSLKILHEDLRARLPPRFYAGFRPTTMMRRSVPQPRLLHQLHLDCMKRNQDLSLSLSLLHCSGVSGRIAQWQRYRATSTNNHKTRRR